MFRRKLAQKRSQLNEEAPISQKKKVHQYESNEKWKSIDDDTQERFLEEAVLGVAENVIDNILPEKFETKPQVKECNEEVKEKKWEDSDDEEEDDRFGIDNPSWAGTFQEEESGDSDEETLKSHSHNILATSSSLPSSSLAFSRVTNANKEDPSKAGLSSVQFHQTATVLLVASVDHTVRLFAIDGHKNRKIHSVFLDRTPVHGAKFNRDGSEIIIGSNHKSFYIYDMEGSTGVTFRPKLKGLAVSNMAKFEISPDGRFIVFLGLEGYVHLFSQKTKELIESFKTNGLVASAKFSKDGKFLYTYGEEGSVYVWDLDVRECIHKFADDGCINGFCMDVSPDGKYVALGSESGIVNLYDHDTAMSSRTPKPVKAVKNLRTACHGALFNPQSELLALTSKFSPAGIRLVHFPSMTVLPNFPCHFESDLNSLTTMDFSPSSGYMAVGNAQGKALLYRLNHYKTY